MIRVEEFIDTTLTTRNRSNYQKVVELVHEHQLDYLDNPTYLRAWYYTIRAITHTEEVAWRFYDHLMAAARILKINLIDEISLGLEHGYITRDQAIAVATTTWHVESMLSELPLTDEELIRNAHLFVSHNSAVVTAFGHRILTLIDAPDIARAALAADTHTAIRETLRVLGGAATGVDKLEAALEELCTSVDSQIAQLAAALLGRPAATPTCEIHPPPPVWQPPALTHDIPARLSVHCVEVAPWLDPLTACADLGQEFLFSTPSHADFSIAADVFIDRLRAYARAGQPILEPDFVLALGRLRIHDADQVARQVVGVRVPLYPDPGVDAGQLAAAYAHDPFRDPGMRGRYGKDVEYPASLSVLPNRWAGNSYDHRAFPRFADSAFCRFLHDPEGLEGVAFAGSPLPAPALAALFRSSANQETIEVAWQRGLVREGNIDAALFDATTLPHVITLCYRLAQKGMAGFVIKLLAELSQCFPVQEVADALADVRRCVEQSRK